MRNCKQQRITTTIDSFAAAKRDNVHHHWPTQKGRRWLGDGELSPVSALARPGRMAIYGFLQNSGFDPESIKVMTAAYETAREQLGLKDRSDPLTELVARKIIEIAQTGVRDPSQLCERALSAIGKR
jgi:hypothetical protein